MLRPGDEPVRGYRLEAFLGKGQYGEVWRARSPGGAKAALKFLDLGGRSGWKEFRAVQRVKEIRHANLMPITALWVFDKDGNLIDDAIVDSILATDAGDRATKRSSQTLRNTLQAGADNQPLPRQLIVASLLGDRNLLELLEHYQQQGKSGIPVDELLAYMEQAAKGIDFLNTAQHDLGQGPVAIQHCDIKPENIMLVGDSVLVCDFGLASVLTDAQAAATATGMVGSLAYMSPECVSRKPSWASDQYSLAISYIELRTGELPFAEKTFASVLDSIRNSKLDLSHVTTAEAHVLRRATASVPAERFPTAAAMVAALKRAQASDAIQVVTPAKNRLLPLLAALSLGGLTVWMGLRWLPEKSDHLLPPKP
ncbi:MAG: protein kinase, partial [Planctomycetota bacterium]|nr:protein kinase [Planctomycetota bacterium]